MARRFIGCADLCDCASVVSPENNSKQLNNKLPSQSHTVGMIAGLCKKDI